MTYIILVCILLVGILFSFFVDAIIDKKITKQHQADYDNTTTE